MFYVKGKRRMYSSFVSTNRLTTRFQEAIYPIWGNLEKLSAGELHMDRLKSSTGLNENLFINFWYKKHKKLPGKSAENFKKLRSVKFAITLLL